MSDVERQAAADRLRAAHDEGRLDLREYDDRLVQAYASVTYADLDRLFAGLPATRRVPDPAAGAPAVRAAVPPAVRQGASAAMPRVLQILWIDWLLAVASTSPPTGPARLVH